MGAGPRASRRSPRSSARTRGHSRTFSSRSSSNQDFSRGRRADGSSRRSPTGTSASSRAGARARPLYSASPDMGARRGLLVYIPGAGQRDRRPAMEALAREAAARDLELALLPTRRSGDAAKLVSEGLRSPPDLIVVAGGDGTVAEVAGALAGSTVPMAVVPTGTTNVVAREFGVASFALAQRSLHSGRTAALSVWLSAG